MLIRLIYTSRALSPLPLDLKDILASARKNNAQLGLTGALCFLDGVYMQYLEGEDDVINTLYDRIALDRRHKDVRTLERCPIGQRAFAEWSMALVTWNDETRAVFERFAPGEKKKPDLHGIDQQCAAALFTAFAATSNWIVA